MAFGSRPPTGQRVGTSSFSRGMRTAALVLIGGAVASLLGSLAVASTAPGHVQVLAVAVLVLLAMALLLMLLIRSSSVILALSYLATGAVAIFLTTSATLEEPGGAAPSDAGGLSFVKIALILVASSTGGARRTLLWCSGGFLIAEVSSALAGYTADVAFRFDGVSFSAYVFVTMVILLGWFSRGGGIEAQPVLARAARDELVFDLRHRIELNAAALLHDTVLNNLAAISTSAPGPLAENVRARLESDLESLAGEEWLSADETQATPDDDLWIKSALHLAVQEGRSLGLTVEVTGDQDAACRVAPEIGTALGLAVKQCLANVARHSGSHTAEIAIHGAADELLVMVIDTGRGFVEQEVGGDRLGLRTSVRQRISAVGGTVQVWTTPGRGTSIVIRVPTNASLNDPALSSPTVASEKIAGTPRSLPRLTGGL